MADFFAPLPLGATSSDPRIATRGRPVPWSWPGPGSGTGWGFQRSANHKHQGVDLFVDIGTPVFAVADGEVVQRNVRMPKPPRATGPGWYLVLKHSADPHYSRYLHLSERHVGVGDKVMAGQPIGRSGKTLLEGRDMESPPHLHFEILTSWPMGGEPEGGSVLSSIDPTSWAASHSLRGAVSTGSGSPIVMALLGLGLVVLLRRRRR